MEVGPVGDLHLELRFTLLPSLQYEVHKSEKPEQWDGWRGVRLGAKAILQNWRKRKLKTDQVAREEALSLQRILDVGNELLVPPVADGIHCGV